jgi:hypothetical protein
MSEEKKYLGAGAGNTAGKGAKAVKILEFDGTDYPTWKFKAEALLRQKTAVVLCGAGS